MGEDARMAAEEWRQAELHARAAEERLKRAWDEYHQRRSEAPSPELHAEVSSLRKVAADKLEAAMKLSHRDSRPPSRFQDL